MNGLCSSIDVCDISTTIYVISVQNIICDICLQRISKIKLCIEFQSVLNYKSLEEIYKDEIYDARIPKK